MPSVVTECVPVTNRFLATLSRVDFGRINAGLEAVKLIFGEVLLIDARGLQAAACSCYEKVRERRGKN